MSSKRALTALALVVAAAAGVTLRAATHTTSSPRPAHAVASLAAAEASPERASVSVPRRARIAGDFRRYAIDSRVVVTSDGSAPAPSAAPTLRLKGAWTETVARVEAGRATMIIAFSPSEVAPTTLSREDVARPFVVEVGVDGRVAGVAFARGVSGDARQALRSLVAEVQITPPSRGAARSWQVDEEDTTGRYRALYSATSATEVERRKGSYLEVLSDRGLAAPGPGERYDVDSVTRFQLDAEGAVVEARLRESLRVATGADTPSLSALAMLDMDLLEQGRGTVVDVDVGPFERLASLTATSGSEVAHDAQIARGMDLPALESRLAEIERMKPTDLRRAAAHAIPQARAVIRIDRAAAVEAARLVADPSTAPTTRGILSAALATAETDEARDALLDLARSDDADARLAGARALTQIRNADGETVSALRSLIKDKDPSVAGAASLALGANVRGAGGAAGGDANAAAVADLIALYDAATGDAARIAAVQALGNAGGREVLKVLIDAIGRSEPLAEAAVFSLRYVPGDDVDQMLDAALRGGPPGMRIAAVQAVAVRDRRAWAPRLAALLDGDLPKEVRQAITAAL